MPRSRSPNRDKAKEMYLNAKGDIKLKDIAEELGVLDTQIRKWKNQDKWDDELKGTLPKKKREQKKRNVTNERTKDKENVSKESYERIDKIISGLKNTELNENQKLFCIYYAKCFNATKAYQKAYGADYNTAMVNGCKLLSHAKIKVEIEKIKDSRLAAAFLDKEDILQKYIDIAFADITDYAEFGYKEQVLGYTEDGQPIMGEANYLSFKASNQIDGTLISEVKTSRQGASIKLYDKMKAFDWLSNFFEMNPEFKYKRDQDYKKLQLERERFEHQKKMDESKVW